MGNSIASSRNVIELKSLQTNVHREAPSTLPNDINILYLHQTISELPRFVSGLTYDSLPNDYIRGAPYKIFDWANVLWQPLSGWTKSDSRKAPQIQYQISWASTPRVTRPTLDIRNFEAQNFWCFVVFKSLSSQYLRLKANLVWR